jgi:outer membrane protein OmpA-like peptidoglycan-associated protein
VSRIGKSLALAGLIATMGSQALAQVPGEQGFFGNIDGRWMWLGNNPAATPQGNSSAQNASGPGGQMLIGIKLDPHWDAALAGDVQGLLSNLTKLQNGTLQVDTNHQHFDLEIGYSDGWWRLNAGLRGIHYLEAVSYNTTVFSGYDQREMLGIGPKVGVGTLIPIAENWAIVGGADAALLYTSFTDFGTGVLATSGSYMQFVPQLDAEFGMSWRSPDHPAFSFTAGGRVAASFNTAITADGSHQGTLLEFGPFVRMAYNFAGPIRRQALTAPSESQAAPTRRDFVVFFDFDRADITLVAAGTIRQAAEDVRHGRPANIQLTGHADLVGSEEYNRILALRRADAVRDELVRNGLSPEQIGVARRGESDPLVATMDDGRTAQNRRAQITF